MAQEQQKTRIVLGTATPGGGFPAYGWPYAEVLNETDPTLAIEPINTKGSNENVVSLDEGKLDLGLVTGEVTYEAISGLGRPKANNLRIINATYSQAGMFMVKADSPYRSISDLKGKSIAWGAASSGFIVLARYVMDGLGLDMKKDFEPHLLEKAGDGPPDGARRACRGDVGRRRRLAAVHGDREGAGGRALHRAERGRDQAHPGEALVPQADHDAGRQLSRARAGRSIRSARGRSCWRAPRCPDDVAYRLARALHKGHAALGKKLDQAQESTLENTLAAAPSRDLIHPGVLKYMREVGLLR